MANPTPLDALNRVRNSMEAAIDLVVASHQNLCTRAIRMQLVEWKKRYPRHDFHWWDSMGIATFEVSPPVLGEAFVDDLYKARGAAGKIGKEARAMADVWNSMEWRVTSVASSAIIRIEDDTNA